tara:strand:+ start:72 stop:269 length:198 start_codon:yes stop_codon:yes gene_type:complete
MNEKVTEDLVTLAEAHLLNVQRELNNLNKERLAIENNIKDLERYLTDSIETVRIAKESLVTKTEG